MIQAIWGALSGTMLGKVFMTLVVAMTPVLEVRGAIPFATAQGIELLPAIAISIIGNMIPIPFIIVFIRRIFAWMQKKNQRLGRLVKKMEAKADKHKEKVLRYEFWGLMILVAIPLPGTGAWTGALVAAMLDMQLKKALPAIFFGVVVAAAIVSIVTYGVVAIV